MAYSIFVSNIGNVKSRLSWEDAYREYVEYRKRSKTGVGRAGHESVYLINDTTGEPECEYHCNCASCEALRDE